MLGVIESVPGAGPHRSPHRSRTGAGGKVYARSIRTLVDYVDHIKIVLAGGSVVGWSREGRKANRGMRVYVS
jgi:hypothetical protein